MKAFTDKKAARRTLLEQRLSLPNTEKRAIDSAICHLIISLEQFKNCDTLLLYCSTKNELELMPLAQKALELGKNVAFPISVTDSCTLDFRLITSPSELVTGAYSIREPSKDAKPAVFTDSTLCIVPALAIDKRGYRLGYGKGYYDRFLKDFNGISVGAVASAFLLDELPTNQTDIAVDIIITETGVIHLK